MFFISESAHQVLHASSIILSEFSEVVDECAIETVVPVVADDIRGTLFRVGSEVLLEDLDT